MQSYPIHYFWEKKYKLLKHYFILWPITKLLLPNCYDSSGSDQWERRMCALAPPSAASATPALVTCRGQLCGKHRERPRIDAEPSARQEATCVLRPSDLDLHLHLHPAALMKPPLPEPQRAEGRIEERDVLARRLRLEPLLRAWAGPEQELLARLERLRGASVAVWVHHRLPAAGVRRDHVCVRIWLLVEKNALHHRGRAARRRCLFTTRAACH